MSDASLIVRRWNPHDARSIVQWVHTADELAWLAPGTAGPLTAQKAVDWTGPRDNPLALWCADQLVGYGELNPMPSGRRHYWIGHVIVEPHCRGRGWGRVFVEGMLALAFRRWQAAKVSLIVFPQNESAFRCYQRVGLRRTGSHRQHIAATGQTLPVAVMSMTARQYRRVSGGPRVGSAALQRTLQ